MLLTSMSYETLGIFYDRVAQKAHEAVEAIKKNKDAGTKNTVEQEKSIQRLKAISKKYDRLGSISYNFSKARELSRKRPGVNSNNTANFTHKDKDRAIDDTTIWWKQGQNFDKMDIIPDDDGVLRHIVPIPEKNLFHKIIDT